MTLTLIMFFSICFHFYLDHLYYTNNISAKFQIHSLYILGGTDYTNLLPILESYLKIVSGVLSQNCPSRKCCNFVTIYSSAKSHIHIFNMLIASMQRLYMKFGYNRSSSFRGEVVLNCRQTDRWMDDGSCLYWRFWLVT